MRTPGFALLFFVCIVLLPRLGFGAGGAAPAGDASTISTALRRGNAVIAVTKDGGFYQADVKEQVWRKMKTPKMPGGGTLILQGTDSPLMAYYIPWKQGPKGAPGSPFFLAVSRDGGGTWLPHPQSQRITELYIHPDGSFYASVCIPVPGTDAWNYNCRGTVLRSQDMGATWQDIKSNLPVNYIFWGLRQDASHPGMVTFEGAMGNQPVVGYHAADTTYHWVEEKEPLVEWKSPMKGRPGEFGRTEWTARPFGKWVEAMLSNFFTLPFLTNGAGLGVPAAQVVIEKPAYIFRKDGPKIVSLKVILHATPSVNVNFFDNKDEAVFWGMDELTPEKQTREYSPQVSTLVDYYDMPLKDSISAKKIEAIKGDPSLQTVTLDAAHPYVRQIDLAKFDGLSVPGNYKIQLHHVDNVLAASRRYEDGSFGSQVIDITITE